LTYPNSTAALTPAETLLAVALKNTTEVKKLVVVLIAVAV
jgi:hypothetical protein